MYNKQNNENVDFNINRERKLSNNLLNKLQHKTNASKCWSPRCNVYNVVDARSIVYYYRCNIAFALPLMFHIRTRQNNSTHTTNSQQLTFRHNATL